MPISYDSPAPASGFIGPLSVKELAIRTYHELEADRCLGRAAELAFSLAFSIFPLLICLLSILSFVPNSSPLLLKYISMLMPPQAQQVVARWMSDLMESRQTGFFSLGLLFALIGASSGMTALMDLLNSAYDVGERRSFLKVRVIAIFLTLALGLLILGGASLVTIGDNIVGWISDTLRMEKHKHVLWNLATQGLGLLMLLAGIHLVYHFGPDIRRKPKWISAGSVFVVIASLAISWLLSLYLKIMPSMEITYGSLGAFMVLMLWLYLMSLILMIGAEINSEIENAAAPKG